MRGDSIDNLIRHSTDQEVGSTSVRRSIISRSVFHSASPREIERSMTES